MLTLSLTPHYAMTCTLLAPRRLGQSGALPVQAQRQWDRPTRQFTLRSTNRDQAAAEYLWSFVVAHQGDTPFWWDGGSYGTLTLPQDVGTGDGARTEFFLPHRHILTTPDVLVDGISASPQPTLDTAPGLLTFAAPVAADSVITAQTYTCRYKLVFWLDEETLLNEEQFVHGLYRYEGIRLREAIP